MPSAFGIVGATFTEEPERTTAFAVVGIGFAFGAALGQVFGGLLACSGP
jgi:MFS family permease